MTVVRFALLFLAGHGCIHVLPHLPNTAFLVVLPIALVPAVVMRAWWLVAFVLGIAWSWGHAAARLAADLPEALEGSDLVVHGIVSSLPDTRGRNVRFVLDVTHAGEPVSSRLLLTWYDAPLVPQTGERWQLVVRLKRRNGFANPGGFDYEGHLFRAGIGATGYVRADERNRRLTPAGWRCLVTQARAWLATRIEAAMGTHSPMLGVVQGLAIGDTRRMTPEQWRVFAATGTTHLMAISGLHVTMLAAMAAWVGGLIVRCPAAQARGWCAFHGQAIAGFGAAVAYSLLAGFSIPTQRTTAMLCVYFVARWCRRHLAVGHALGLALIAVLLLDPFAPLAVGAWLSFAAVAILMLISWGRLQRASALGDFVRSQAAMTLGLLPILLLAFGAVSLVASIANAVAIPAFSFVVVPLVLIGTLLASFSPALASLPLALASRGLELLWLLLEWLAAQPLALWHFPEIPPWSLLVVALGSLALVIPAIWPLRVLGVAACGHVFLIAPNTPGRGDFDVASIDVGQGLATVVRTERHVLVYDTGPSFQSGHDAAALALLPYLRARGIRKIDAVVVSHGDLDHRGGLETLLKEMRVQRVVLGPSVEQGPQGAERCVQGARWSWDDVEFEFLHPSASYHGNKNDTSCVLRIVGRGGTALLTGDIEAGAEAALVHAGIGPVDLALIPHHGSRTSSSPAFVAALAPKIAVVSTGYRNRWGFPQADVIARWREHGAQVYDTAESGAIEAMVRAAAPIQVREHRLASQRYWSRTAAR